MHDLLPQILCADVLGHHGRRTVNGVLLRVGLPFDGSVHEFIVDLDGYVRSRHFAFGHFGIDESLGIGVLDADGQHQCAAPSVLCHLAGRVAVAFHERNEAGRSQGRIFHRRAFRTDVRQVMAYTAAPFHQLHLFFVDADDAAV